MPRALFISPHLDDAAFSCAEPMLALREAGWQVDLATVFTASVSDPQGFALACQLDKGLSAEVDYMRLRRAEDIAFCDALDLAAHHLDLAEAPHRGYADVTALFGPVHADDPAPMAVAERLDMLRQRLAPDLWFAPIGIGGHVDHRVVIDAVEAAAGARALRYADQPYRLKQPEVAERELAGWAETAPLVFASQPARRVRALAAVRAYITQLEFQFGHAETMQAALDAAQAEGVSFWHADAPAAVVLAPFIDSPCEIPCPD